MLEWLFTGITERLLVECEPECIYEQKNSAQQENSIESCFNAYKPCDRQDGDKGCPDEGTYIYK